MDQRNRSAFRMGAGDGAAHVQDRGDMASDASRGSAVAFNLVLLNVATGQKVWKATFDQNQQSLTDNVLAVKNSVKLGFKWLSANDLAHLGVKEVLKTFLIRGIS